MTRRFGLIAIWGIALSSLLGCSDGDASLANVTGRIFFYGSPAKAEVIFEPVQADGSAHGRPSTAFTDADGSYTLFLTADQKGVEPGQHQISIKVYRWQGGAGGQLRGAGSAAIKTAHLFREVVPGDNRFDFFIGY